MEGYTTTGLTKSDESFSVRTDPAKELQLNNSYRTAFFHPKLTSRSLHPIQLSLALRDPD
jgi:hypothetical protein